MGGSAVNPKVVAAKRALEYVRDAEVIGLGSGTTVREFAKLLAEEMPNATVVPTSLDSELLARSLGLRVASTWDYTEVEVAVDGADEVDPHLNLLKGGGGCHTLEKVVDYSAKRFVVIVDSSKLVNSLASKHPIPVEVIPRALKVAMKTLSRYGRVEIRACRGGKLGPVVTDSGNLVLDLYTEPLEADKAEKLEVEINAIPGVVDNGLFTRRKPDVVIVGYSDGSWREITR